MSQSTNNMDEKNIKDNLKKVDKIKKDHSTRNIIIFLIIFTIVCVGITVVLIYNQKKNSVDEKILSGEAVIDETGNLIENDNVVGVASLNETYKKNDLKVSNVVYKSNNTTNSDIEVSYIQIDGLKDKELENKINERLKQAILDKYDENKKFQYYSLTESCTANFANVLSVKISEYSYDEEDYKNYQSGINIDLTTGNDIKFNDLFTYNAGIKNILSKSAYDSLAESYTSGGVDSVLDDTPVYGATEDNEFYSEEKESREENYAQIEDEVFKLMSKFNNGATLNYSFSPRCVYVYENDYTVKINMKKYYSQIAIYNRFNNISDVFDENYQSSDILKNDTIPVFVSYTDDYTDIDVVSADATYTKYLNLKKESDDIVYCINLNYVSYGGTFIDANQVIEQINVIKNKIKSDINQYANIHDGNSRFIQFLINYYDESSYGYKKEVYCVPNSDNFISTTISYFQNGNSQIYWAPLDKDIGNIWKDCGISYKGILYQNIKYNYDTQTNKWSEKDYTEIYLKNENNIDSDTSLTEETENDTIVNTAKTGKTIVIDAGHQEKGNSEKEPIGPGATETKAKVAGGATGVTTGQTEYSLNLKVATKLKTRLEAEGYTVIMTRTLLFRLGIRKRSNYLYTNWIFFIFFIYFTIEIFSLSF